MKKFIQYYIVALGVILIDQVVKILVKTKMLYGENIPIIGTNHPSFHIHFLENDGAAFGVTVADLFGLIGFDMSETTAKIILTVFSIVAVSVIGVILYRTANHKSPLPLFVAFILGGAIGNIIDRVFYGVWFANINGHGYPNKLLYGRVVDMFYFNIWEGYLPASVPIFGGNYISLFPVFNIADAAISVGIISILLFQKRFFDLHDKRSEPEPANTETTEIATENDTIILNDFKPNEYNQQLPETNEQ